MHARLLCKNVRKHQHTRILYLYRAYPPTPAAANPRMMTQIKLQLTSVLTCLPAYIPRWRKSAAVPNIIRNKEPGAKPQKEIQ